jgi:hypothetical protein
MNRKMRAVNRKRMKKVAILLGTITIAIIVLAIYKLFVVI